MSESKRDWSTVDVSGDPHIILGRRQGKSITAGRVDVHADLHEEMRKACRAALMKIAATTSRDFDPNASLVPNEEHFRLTVEDVKRLSVGLDQGAPSSAGRLNDRPMAVAVGPQTGEARDDPAIIECLRDPTLHPVIDRSKFREFNPFFYGLCFQQHDDSWVSFVRKTNPQQFFKLGRTWCQYGDTLKRVDQQPTFALESWIDVVYGNDDLIGFSDTALKFLFTDVRLARTAVPQQVAIIRRQMQGDLPLSEAGAAALIAAGARKSSIASRIYGLSARLSELRESGPLNAERFRAIAGDDSATRDLISVDGELDFADEDAETFLDFIEGRYFEDDWTGSERRADRFSKRR